jgi:hypothetical protein
MRRLRPTLLPLLFVVGACTDQVTAPGVCPIFCPADSLTVEDVVLTDVIGRDTAHSGYLEAYQSEVLRVADVPGVVDSRAIFLMNKTLTQVVLGSDTVPITVDSSWLRVNIVQRDTNPANRWVKLYGLPLGLDSTTTFADLVPAFSAVPVDSANIDSLLADTVITDTILTKPWGGPFRTDSAGHVLRVVDADSILSLFFVLDTLQAPFSAADSGQRAFGVRVSPDTVASIALGTQEVGRGASLRRFYHYIDPTTDSTPDSTRYGVADQITTFDSYVFDPPNAPLDSGVIDSTLVVGGAPAVRSLVRLTVPSFLRDTADVVRATLVLVPTAAVQGAVADSFAIFGAPVVTDLGAKSPISLDTRLWGRAFVHIGSADTLRMELTDLVRIWARDTSAITTLVLSQCAYGCGRPPRPEAATYAQIRFYSSRVPAFRPSLHVTYVRRFPFGAP